MTGRIKKILYEKGFGFIQTEGGKDIFFHSSQVEGVKFENLKEGELVNFDTEKGKKGTRAVRVDVLHFNS